MSVIIKDLKMPESCFHCMLAFQDQDSEHNVYWTCAPLNEDAMGIERSPDCPLVEIPPHGRLIDADALLNMLNKCMFPSDMVTTTAVSMGINWIKEAPTVIEAEEGE